MEKSRLNYIMFTSDLNCLINFLMKHHGKRSEIQSSQRKSWSTSLTLVRFLMSRNVENFCGRVGYFTATLQTPPHTHTPAHTWAITHHLLIHTLSYTHMLQQMGVASYREWLEAGSCVYLGSICGWVFNSVCSGERDYRCVRTASCYDPCLLYLSSADIL